MLDVFERAHGVLADQRSHCLLERQSDDRLHEDYRDVAGEETGCARDHTLEPLLGLRHRSAVRFSMCCERH